LQPFWRTNRECGLSSTSRIASSHGLHHMVLALDSPPVEFEGSHLFAALPDEAFSWRRKAAEPCPNQHEDTVAELRRRLESMCGGLETPKKVVVMRPKRQEVSSMSDAGPACLPPTASTSDVSSRCVSPAEERRRQFLSMLSHGLGELDLPSQRSCPVGSPSSNCSVSQSVTNAMASNQTSSTEERDFFAGVQALQERMAQRRLKSKKETPTPGVPCTASGGSVFAAPTAKYCIPSPLDAPANAIPTSSVCGASSDSALPQRERRRRSSESESSNDTLKSGSDDLLRWAEDVLRRAQDKGPIPSHQAGQPRSHSHLESERRASDAKSSTGAKPPLTPGVKARRQKAEDLREKIRRLTEESEQECERLASEEQAQRLRFAREEGWRNRVSCAADEFRSNFSRVSFDSARAPVAPSTARSSSMPARRPCHDQWAKLEANMEAGHAVRFVDIPWPKAAIIGVVEDDSPGVAKRKLTAALRRWHPDKWKRILDHVPQAEQQMVMERVKSVAQNLLDEKAKLTGPGGVLH